MKKLLTLLLITVSLMALTLTVSAADGFVGEKEFTVASYNGTQTFFRPGASASKFEDSAYWLIDQKNEFNLKYVSILGNIATWPGYRYASVGGDDAKLVDLSLNDETWNLQYSNFANAIQGFKDMEIPMGIAGGLNDYIPDGRRRDNLIAKYAPAESYMYEGYTCEYIDEINSYFVVENNGVKYMIFTLELWPRTGTLTWFNEIASANPDKYIIVFTQSFVDGSGAMYTMWDWANGFKAEGTTTLKGYNLTNIDKARDGEGIWNYSFSAYDNVIAVISSNVKDNGNIVTGKAVRENGVETALIGANADNGRHSTNPSVLLTKFSADNKTVTCAWASEKGGVDKANAVTVTLDKIGTLKESTSNDSLPQIPVQYNGANSAYIFGYEGNTFRPNNNMTRAEACTIFARLLLGTQTIPDGYTTRFEDVLSGDWFYNAIAYLDETGFFFRNKNTTYKPNEPITRAEFVELANFASSLSGNKTAVFTDVPTDHFYYDSIMAAAKSGLVNGYEDNTFRPDKTITRAEVVTVINRLLGLKVSDRTVDTTKLENEFVDISTHWGRLNILMASNSNVHGAYYYNTSLDGIKEDSKNFIFENRHVSITVEKKSGKVLSITNLYTGEDVKGASTNASLVYITNVRGAVVPATKLELDGNRIKVTFRDKSIVYMIVEVHDDFMTFEIDNELPKSIKSVTFGNLVISSTAVNAGYRLNAIGMSAWTNPVNKGYRDTANSSIAHAYTMYDAGVMGAKLGVVFSKAEDAIPFLQKLTDTIDKSVGLVSKAGGAYARVYEPNFGDYAMTTNIDPENLDTTIALLKEMDVDQLDIHQSANTFIQGDFTFAHTESGTAVEYYEKYGKKYEEAGIDTILHTYAYYIAPASVNLLNDSKWHKDLELMDDVYTLRKKLSKTNRNVATVEDATAFNANALFFVKTSKYVLIDEEIIQVAQGTKSGLINCVRGAMGTKAAVHEAGTPIYHLSGYFSMLTPKLGSDLFYHIADLTAKAYNEGHFSMLYIDAIDGLSRHMPEGHEVWYYFQMFLHRITSQCEKDPQVETSAGAPSEWNVRGRQGAWDYSNYSIKKFNANHIASNINSMKTNMTTTLGWFSFFTDGSTTLGLKNTFQKTMFRDDLDFVGTNAIIYDMSMVYNPFSVSSINGNPFHKANILYYVNTYSKLRKEHYFSNEVIEQVKKIGGEWRVIEKDGKYFFERRSYDYQNFGNAVGVEDKLVGGNPFLEQTPFIRIESRYSTLSDAPFEFQHFQFDENTPIGTKKIIKTFGGINFTTNGMVATTRIKGTGRDGDAMLISFAYGPNGENDGRRDHFIDLNYEGWREYVLLDFDNADYDVKKYPFEGISVTGSSYQTYRFTPSHYAIDRLTIRTVGETATNAVLDDIILQPHSDAPIKNPTVKVGAQTMTFNCEMKGGDYLEYSPETGKAILYHNTEQTTEEVTFTGNISIAGSYTATFSAEAETSAPVRARLVFGFSGQQIGN